MIKKKLFSIIYTLFLVISCKSIASDSAFEDKFGRNNLEPVDFNMNQDTNFEIAILGNSITYHPPVKDLGWPNSNGMSATSESKDYAHQLLRLLSLDSSKAYIRNIYPLEIDSSPLKQFQNEFKRDLSTVDTVVVFMGDNTNQLMNLANFSESYRGILSSFKENVSLICVSSFWSIENTDKLIKEICQEFQGAYLDIGWVYYLQRRKHFVMGVIGIDFDFEKEALQVHPDNLSMYLIARQIFDEMEHSK